MPADLFGEDDVSAPSAARAASAMAQGPARVQEPDRRQIELRAVDLESLLAPDHPARLVWGYVERQDLSALYGAIKARGSAPGRRAIDPRVLFALWLYATLDGVGSGREIARLSRAHDAYRWLCGGVQVNYHALNDFRAQHEALLDELLTHNVAALAAIGVVRLTRVAQDGVRVRASAGSSSFRRRERLGRQLQLAQELVQQLKDRARHDPGAASRREQAARERATREREQRIEQALAQLPEIEATKRRNGRPASQARASTTDAQARVMKMADGGFRPAYNVQLATDCASQVVVGVDVSTAGTDMAQLVPMVQQVHRRLGRTPEQWLVDGGFPAHEQIDAVAGKTELYAPVPKPAKGKGGEPPPPGSEFAPRADDSPAVAQWRARMNTAAARAIYKDRAASAECVNAQLRNRGLQRLPVRGLLKVRSVALLHALAHNLMRTLQLAPQLLGAPAAATTPA